MTVGPNYVITNHCVERGDHLAHHRNDLDLRLLSSGFETVMEGLERRIPIAGAHRRHVQRLAYIRTTAPNAPPSFERTTLESIGRDADQRSDLFTGHVTELRQERDQRAGQQLLGAGDWNDVISVVNGLGVYVIVMHEHINMGGDSLTRWPESQLDYLGWTEPHLLSAGSAEARGPRAHHRAALTAVRCVGRVADRLDFPFFIFIAAANNAIAASRVAS
jgi:hypothetical protein